MEDGEIKVFNPQKEIASHITLEILIRHRDAMKQARTGELVGVAMEQITDNDRKNHQVRALNLIISAQREMITVSRPIIFFRSTQKWKKENKPVKTDKEATEEAGLEVKEPKREVAFEEHENDYNKMMEWLEFLGLCSNAILSAERTKSLADDFLTCRQTQDGDKFELTNNFFEMLEDLESSYEQIYLLMLTNKIVSAGIEEDEELSYKQLEQEAVTRVVEA